MKKLIVGLLPIFLLISISCSQAPLPAPMPKPVPGPAPAPTPGPVPRPAPVFTNSASDSRVAELEAQIKQLQSEIRRLQVENQQLSGNLAAANSMTGQLELENQRIKAEIQRLNNELATVTAMLQNVQGMVNSLSYSNIIGDLNDVQSKSNELAYFARGLPHLPPPPPGLTVSRINDAIQKARKLREILQLLPPPPPLAPSWWRDLDIMKNAFIEMTDWMEDLRDIPQFLESSGNFEELRSRIEGYLNQVQNTASDAKGTLELLRDAVSP